MNSVQLKEQLKRYAVRIDAMSLRERVILFVVVIVCLLALADTFWLTPAQNKLSLVTQRYTSQQSELNRLRAEMQTLGNPLDASKGVKAEIDSLDQQIAKVNEEIKAIAPMADKGPKLEQALLQFLRRYPGLTLVSTGTLKEDDASANQALKAMNLTGLTRRGMSLTVSGSYADLERYLSKLEYSLPSIRWGSLQIKSDQQPVEMTLQVYVVGVQQ